MTEMGSAPDLQMGDSGDWVTYLQQRLQGLSLYDGSIDGVYSEDTDAAVRQLHENAGLSHEGGVFAQSWQALLEQEQLAGISAYGDQDAGQDYTSEDTGESEIQASQLSEDGQWQWDGSQWQPAAQEQSGEAQGNGQSIEAGQLSEDGHWRWDGSEWQPVAQESSEDSEDSGQEGGQAGGGDQHEIAVNDAADDPVTEEAELLV